MNSIKTVFIRLYGNLYYLMIHYFCEKKYIVLDTCFNSVLDGDIGAVYEELKYSNQIIVVKNDKNVIKYNEIYKKSFKYYYYLANAKLLVTNNAHHLYVNKNKNTIVVNTWHGTPYKDVSINRLSTIILKFMNRNSTVHTSGNKYFEQKYLRDTIQFKGTVLKNGFFRNDILYSVEKFYNKYDFCKNGKLNILISPTWRDYGDAVLLDKTLELVTVLEKEFSNRYNILIRMHNKSKLEDKIDNNHIFDVSGSEFEIQKLLKNIDILITDYSSIFFDYALLEKPIILYQYDEEEYKEKRGLLIDDIRQEYLQNVFRESKEIVDFIKNISFDNESEKIKKFNLKIGNYETFDSLRYFLEKFLSEEGEK